MRFAYTTSAFSIALLLSTSPYVHAQIACPFTPGLATPYNSNNGLKGVMFDVVALENLTITCFEVNFAAGTCDPIIYHKTGTHVGAEQTPGAWTPIDSAINVPSAGVDLPTYVPIAVNVSIPAGSTHAFYITNRAGTPNVKYTDGTALSAVFASDASMQVLQGSGVNYPFAFVAQPRKFNGTIHYTTSTAGIGEHGTTGALTLAPNPVVDRLRLGGGKPGTTLLITDALGRVALRSAWSTELDVTALAAGSYVLTLVDSAGRPRGTQVFLKQ